MVDFGFEVFYLCTAPGEADRETRPMPPAVTRIPWTLSQEGWPWRKAIKEMKQVLARVQPDLVHAGPIQDGAFLAAKAGFEPLVSMSWGSDLLQRAQSGLDRWKARKTLKRSAAFICDCRVVAQVAHTLGAVPERMVIFPWGVDLAHFSPSGVKDSRHPRGAEDSLHLLSTRSWEPVYGIQVLLEGFAILAQRMPDLHLTMLGDGSQRTYVRDFITRHDLQDRIQLAGQVDFIDLPAIYRAADIYVSTSRSDGSSVSLLEAMACGLPALVSDIPGNREWVEAGVNGWLFKNGDPSAFADALQVVSRKRTELPEIGAAGRSIVEHRADWSRNRVKILDAYQIAMQGVD